MSIFRSILAFQSTLPARGATKRSCGTLDTFVHFNPRSPHGERQCRRLSATKTTKFQSTLPARGATMIAFLTLYPYHHFNPRSPHGERRQMRTQSSTACVFQSTLPARGATQPYPCKLFPTFISIHAPRTGSDAFLSALIVPLSAISIHAPRTGSDSAADNFRTYGGDFNPRSPHGERHCRPLFFLAVRSFQSTLPARGATCNANCYRKFA